MKITQETYDKIRNYNEEEYGGVVPPHRDLDVFTRATLKNQTAKDQYDLLNRIVRLEKGYKILDFGSGLGRFVLYLRSMGFFADGYEIDPRLIDIASDFDTSETQGSFLYSEDGIVPTGDSQYDVIFSHFVLEHVGSLQKYLSEGLRLLKPQGSFLVVTCNHALGYEFHYDMWLPLFSKDLSKRVLRRRNRDVMFFDTLSIVTPHNINNTFKELHREGLSFEVEDVGQRLFISQVFDTKIHSEKFIKYAKILNKVGALKFLPLIGLHNPLIYLITKQ